MIDYSINSPVLQVAPEHQEAVLTLHSKYVGKRRNQLFDLKTLSFDEIDFLGKVAGMPADDVIYGQYIRTYGMVQHTDHTQDHTIIVISKHENFCLAGYVGDDPFIIIPKKFDIITFTANKLHSLAKLMSYKTPFECYVLHSSKLLKEVK